MSFKILIISLISLLISMPSFSSSTVNIEDVAIGAKTGDTFITDRFFNKKGHILLLKDLDENFKQDFHVLDFEAANAKLEIELNKDNQLTYLVQIDDQWMINGFRKENDEWSKMDKSSMLTGSGILSSLTTLPDGRLAVSIKEKNKENILLMEFNNLSAKYQILEVISKAELKVHAAKIKRKMSINHGLTSTIKINATCDKEGGDCDEVRSNSGLGFTAGAVTGVGFAYRRHLANKWGYQIGGILWGSSNNVHANLGATVFKTLHQSKWGRFMVISGASTFYNGNNEIDWDQCDYDVPDSVWEENPSYDPCSGVEASWNNSTTINLGIGIGMEFPLGKNIGLVFELPLTLMLRNDGFGIYPIPSLSLIYYF